MRTLNLKRALPAALVAALACAAVAPVAEAARPRSGALSVTPCGLLAWCGDFASTGFANWDGFDGNVGTPAARRRYFALLPSRGRLPVGRRYFRALVDEHAVKAGEAGQRSMAYLYPHDEAARNKTGAFEGAEQWYHLSMYFPAAFRAHPGNWNWLVEWHNWPNAPCCANIALTVVDNGRRGRRHRERLSMRVMGGGAAEYPVVAHRRAERNPLVRTRWVVGEPRLRRRHWYDVLVRVRWSYRHDRGLVEWWLDGRRIVSWRTATLFWYADDNENFEGQTPGPGQAYLMVGYYRPDRDRGTVNRSVVAVHYASARRGPTRRSVGYPR